VIAGQVFWLIASIICSIGGAILVREWHVNRHYDLRQFSWKRWLTKDEGLNPLEKLINGIIGIVIGMFATMVFLSSLE
jgi:uncharacterized membrane protein